jgi:hypothetical protein
MAVQIVMDHTGDTRHHFNPADARAVSEGSLAFWASALHGMGYHSIPTRRASLISVTTDIG